MSEWDEDYSDACDFMWECLADQHNIREAFEAYLLAGWKPESVCPQCGGGQCSTPHNVAVMYARRGVACEILYDMTGNLDAPL